MKWLTRAPLPMLALTAAYGVFRFQALFVPAFFAFVGAAAFELTYVALAIVATDDKRRAGLVAFSAVAVSVLYNTLSGLFDRRPELLTGLPWWGDMVLAVLHGLPLAAIAYNMSVLFLHEKSTQGAHETVQGIAVAASEPLTVRAFVAVRARAMLEEDRNLRLVDLAARLGTNVDMVRRALADMAAAEQAAPHALVTDSEEAAA